MVDEYANRKIGEKEKIFSEHKLKYLLELHNNSTNKLKELYEDKDGERKAEVQALSGPNEFTEFYNRLKQIKDFYKKHPDEISIPLSIEFEETTRAYLNTDDMSALNMDYKKYLEQLNNYLYGFITRIKPLMDMDAELGKVDTEFQKMWANGTFPGWSKETESVLANTGAHLDLSAFSSWEELVLLGLDRLKSALMALGVKCGGTLEERAQRLFSTKGMKTLDPSILVKKNSGKNMEKEQARQKEIASMEAQLYRYAEFVSEQRMATKENVQRKQARTGGERDDKEDNDDIPYNPKNLPLGWDGKPIPYWLYKLHGLNISYNCEICGNFTYKGPKAFQRHFAEWRHAHGMRCLGIPNTAHFANKNVPNTAHFANVTQIEDAITLWEKLKSQKQNERWIPDQEEEYEDSLGNVVNRKTYEDLKRQGLL
uniref:Matrin-type domain-containing protein n=1 Tax=Megaselia scalaris TaxID=36166 RepID=T1GK99_MEGSC